MQCSVALRRAVPGDAQAIGRVFDAAVLAGWTYVDDIESLVPMFGPDHWDRLVADLAEPDLLMVAVDDDAGAVVGFVATRVEPGEMYLLFVHPDHGRRGIARRLLGAAHRSLRNHGHAEAHLFTHEANRRARAVYEAAGYRHDGGYRDEEFRGHLLREVRLRIVLS